MPTVYLNIGSNKGDRKAHIEQAVALIASAYQQATLRRSDYIETEAWGYESDNAFVNLGVALDFESVPDAYALLDTLQAIERRISAGAHRNADGTYCDRDIDIDIICIDGVTANDERLTLPHPRAHLRAFVMVPLRQLGGDLGLTPEEL